MASKKISQLSSSLAPPLSGVTAVVHDGTTYKSSLSTLKQVLVDSGSHYFTGSQFINGNLTISGSLTAQQFILSSSIANIVTETISGSSNFGNSLDDRHIFTGSVRITGSLSTTGSFNTKGDLHVSGTIYSNNLIAGDPQSNFNTIKLVTSDTAFTGALYSSIYIDTDGGNEHSVGFAVSSYTPYGDYPVGIIFGGGTGSVLTGANDAIYLGEGKIEIVKDTSIHSTLVIGSGIIGEETENLESLHVGTSGSVNIAHFQANNEYYGQVNIFNINSGSFASTDLVLTADNGNEVVHYVDLGINSSTYDGGEVGYNNDAYLINAGNDLYLGTLGGTYHPAEVKLFTMGNWTTPQITLHSSDNQISFNTTGSTEGYTYEFSGSAKFNNDIKVDGVIYNNEIQNDNQDLNIKSYNYNNIGLWSEGGTVNVTGSLLVSDNVEAFDITSNGVIHLGSTSERITPYDDINNITHDFNDSSILYLTNLSDNFDINLYNVPTDNNKGIGITVMVEQGSTAYTNSTFNINDDSQSVLWFGGSLPDGTPNTTNIFSFSILKINDTWKVFGQLTTF
jgi:cytoskeletal protein CcmA (bactofilin family)